MDIIFIFLLGVLTGIILGILAYIPVIHRRRYCFKKGYRMSSEYTPHIEKKILECDNDQHSNQ